MSIETIMFDLFRRIPALADLRGVARLDAEEAVRHALTDAINDYLTDAEPASTEVLGDTP